MSAFKIMASSKSVPHRVVTNDDLAQIMDTSDEWIKRRTGISRRHIATDESTTSMSIEVARALLKKAQIDPKDLDYVIVATMSSDYQTPATAASVQGAIGATNAVAFDIDAACTGFAFGTSILDSLLAKKSGSCGILIGAEVLSKLLDWSDRSTAVLFGDGAAGVLVQNDPSSSSQVLGESLKTFGNLGSALTAGHFADVTPFGKNPNQEKQFFKMDGHQVFNFALKKVPLSIKEALTDADLSLNDIDVFVMHQANARIIASVVRKLGLPKNRFPIDIDEYGNTAAASEPLLLADLLTSGKIQRGNKIALVGFGGGLTTGTVIINY